MFLSKAVCVELRTQTHQHHVLVVLIWQDSSISHHNLPSSSHWQGGKLLCDVWIHCQWWAEINADIPQAGKWCSGWQSCPVGSSIFKLVMLSFLLVMPLSWIKYFFYYILFFYLLLISSSYFVSFCLVHPHAVLCTTTYIHGGGLFRHCDLFVNRDRQ